MGSQKEIWNEVYCSSENIKVKYDLWLEKYEDILAKSKDIPIIDLGCGSGNNTLYLKERGYKVISCDFSEKALEVLGGFIDKPDVRCFNMLDGLPFEDNSAAVIISDLSLHYFTWKDTEKILGEIRRVLMKDGCLLCRVNSVNDKNYGAGQGIKVEENYYDLEGKLKRFFDEDKLRRLFKVWDIRYIKENRIERYKNIKTAWEVCAVAAN